jgi:hypothetical protein
MPRGGKRAGAGRRSLVATEAGDDGYYNRLLIGAEFDRRWNELAKAEAIARLDARYADLEVDSDLKALDAIPHSFVRKDDGKSVLALVIEYSKTDPATWPEDLPETISVPAQDFRNRIRNLDSKSRIESVKTPQGSRTRLEQEIAEWASQKYKRTIGQGYVRDCIEEYRRFEAK